MRPDPLAEPWLARKSLPRGGDGTGFYVSGICDAGTRWHLGGESCTQASVVIVWVGCMKAEHVGAVELCQAHNEVIDAQAVATLCSQCRDKGNPGQYVAVLKREKI